MKNSVYYESLWLKSYDILIHTDATYLIVGPSGLVIWHTDTVFESDATFKNDAEDVSQIWKTHWCDIQEWCGRCKSKPKDLLMQ